MEGFLPDGCHYTGKFGTKLLSGLMVMLSPLGKGQHRIPQGAFSSWIKVFRACHVGWSPGEEHLQPSLEIGLFCQGRSRSMLTFIKQIYSLEGHKGRRGSVWKQ